MVSTILHVEDDPALVDLVELSFENFGFTGTTTAVESVAAASAVLDKKASDGETFDLVISDMNLPDGTGLDVVRHVRSNLVWEYTPILILSGDLDPKKVGRAYALGANAYIDKSPRGRSLGDVVGAMYTHWCHDVVPAVEADRVGRMLGRSMVLRARQARIYQGLAERFQDGRSESAFWMSRAVCESNLTNLLAFLRREPSDCDLPDEFLDHIDTMQDHTAEQLSTAERVFEDATMPRNEVYGQVLGLLEQVDIDLMARSIAHVFPSAPAAMAGLRDFLIGTIEDVTAWIDLRTVDPLLRARTAALRVATVQLLMVVQPMESPG